MKLKDRVTTVLILGVILLVFLYNGNLDTKQQSPVVAVDEVKDDIQRRDFFNSFNKFIDNKPHEGSETLNVHPWDIWHDMVSIRALTVKSNHDVEKILKMMSSIKITQATTGYKGTQLKAMFTLDGPQTQKAVFKPRR